MDSATTIGILAALLFVCAGQACADDPKTAEEVAVIEIGAAPGRSLTDHTSSLGPTVAVEFTPIENWLEIETGVTPSFSRGVTEWGTDLLFKKPWTLSPSVEFMAGVGPEWLHTRQGGRSSNAVAGEAILDFMFWPTRWKHKFGWYVEPGYEYSFASGHDRSIGVSFGILIAIRK